MAPPRAGAAHGKGAGLGLDAAGCKECRSRRRRTMATTSSHRPPRLLPPPAAIDHLLLRSSVLPASTPPSPPRGHPHRGPNPPGGATAVAEMPRGNSSSPRLSSLTLRLWHDKTASRRCGRRARQEREPPESRREEDIRESGRTRASLGRK
jgi:hypothetical protein